MWKGRATRLVGVRARPRAGASGLACPLPMYGNLNLPTLARTVMNLPVVKELDPEADSARTAMQLLGGNRDVNSGQRHARRKPESQGNVIHAGLALMIASRHSPTAMSQGRYSVPRVDLVWEMRMCQGSATRSRDWENLAGPETAAIGCQVRIP